MTRNWTIALSLTLVFVCGLAVGGFGHWLYANNTVLAKGQKPAAKTPEEARRLYVEEMQTRLKLNEAQSVQLNAALDETRAKFQAMKERRRPEVKQIQQEQVDKINGFLSEAQRAEYTKLREEREEKAKQKAASGGGGC
jgi:hypothetical protein